MKQEIEIIDKKYIEKALLMLNLSDKLSKEQKELFIELCVMNKLNPIKNEIYAVPFKDNKTGLTTMSTFVSYQVILQRAETFPQFDGYEIIWTTKNDKGDEMPVGKHVCTFIGYRKDRKHPVKIDFISDEWAAGRGLWLTKPRFMMEKTALSVGLKRLFPAEFSGMPYSDVEQWSPKAMEKAQETIKVDTDDIDFELYDVLGDE